MITYPEELPSRHILAEAWLLVSSYSRYCVTFPGETWTNISSDRVPMKEKKKTNPAKSNWVNQWLYWTHLQELRWGEGYLEEHGCLEESWITAKPTPHGDASWRLCLWRFLHNLPTVLLVKESLSAIYTVWITLGWGLMNPVNFRIILILVSFLCFLKLKWVFQFKANIFITPGLQD